MHHCFIGHNAIDFLSSNKVKYWPTPAESSDVNAIEMVCHGLKHHLRKKVKPNNEEELIHDITSFLATVTPDKCKRYINRLNNVIPIVVARGGRASGH